MFLRICICLSVVGVSLQPVEAGQSGPLLLIPDIPRDDVAIQDGVSAEESTSLNATNDPVPTPNEPDADNATAGEAADGTAALNDDASNADNSASEMPEASEP